MKTLALSRTAELSLYLIALAAGLTVGVTLARILSAF